MKRVHTDVRQMLVFEITVDVRLEKLLFLPYDILNIPEREDRCGSGNSSSGPICEFMLEP